MYKKKWRKPCHWNLFLFYPDISIDCRDIKIRSEEGYYEWARDLHFFLETTTYAYSSKNRVCHLSAVWDRSASREREVRVSDEDGDNNRSKITVFFKRRYLGNRKSYRYRWDSVSKCKILRFQRSLAGLPEPIIPGIITVQISSDFNTLSIVVPRYSYLLQRGKFLTFWMIVKFFFKRDDLRDWLIIDKIHVEYSIINFIKHIFLTKWNEGEECLKTTRVFVN